MTIFSWGRDSGDPVGRFRIFADTVELAPGEIVAMLAEGQRFSWVVQAETANVIALEHGWWEQERNDGEVLALMHSELSEVLQALRVGNPPDEHCPEFSSVEVELADLLIRVMDYSVMRKLKVREALLAKMEYNRTRPYKHGGRAF